MRILITGSAGFIGSHIYDRLFDMGEHEVYGIDDLSGGYMENVTQKKYFTNLDLRDREKTAQYIKKLKPEIIFHLAADATEGRSQFTPFSAVDRNLVAYMNLLIPAISNGLKKMILTSSMSVYGKQQVPFKESMIPQPEDIYGISKTAMEQSTKVMANVYGFQYVIIRPHNVYGIRQNLSDPYRNVAGIFINRILHGKNFYIYGDGKQKRAFSHISDIVEPMVKSAFSKKCENKILNLGSDRAITLNKLGELVLKEFFGNNVPPEYMPTHMPDRPQEVKLAYSNHSLAEKLLNYKPKIKIEDGLKEMVMWAKERGAQPVTYLASMEIEHQQMPKTWKAQLI